MMWKPSSVVAENKTRAIVVWVTILITALAYTGLQTAVVIKKRQNPSTRFLVSNQQYQYPPVSVCFRDGAGCGFADGNISTCVASAIDYSTANLAGVRVDAIQGQADNCIEFDLSWVKLRETDREMDPGVTAFIFMDWQSSDNATAEVEYREEVSVFIGEYSSESQDSTFIPYSRNEYSSSDRTYETTVLTIGKTTRKYLSGTPLINYPVQTSSTTRRITTKEFSLFSEDDSYASSLDLDENSAIATVYLEIKQGAYSHTQVEDVEPLEIGALLGNIGGFWELLVLAWGVFFITTSRDTEPTLKARNFRKTIERVASSKKRKRQKLDSAVADNCDPNAPSPPDWESSDGDGIHASGASDSGASKKGERSRRHRAHHPAGSSRPVAYSLPTRISSRSVSGSPGTSATSNTLLQPGFSSAPVADGIVSTASPRWSGLNVASAARKFSSFDAGMAQTGKEVFTVNGRSSSFSNNANGGDNGTARTSFFPTPQASAGKIHHHDSEDESSRSATRPTHEANKFAEDGEVADESDLEFGHAVEAEGRHGRA